MSHNLWLINHKSYCMTHIANKENRNYQHLASTSWPKSHHFHNSHFVSFFLHFSVFISSLENFNSKSVFTGFSEIYRVYYFFLSGESFWWEEDFAYAFQRLKLLSRSHENYSFVKPIFTILKFFKWFQNFRSINFYLQYQ